MVLSGRLRLFNHQDRPSTHVNGEVALLDQGEEATLSGLAAAALGNLGLWTYHAPDVGFMVVLWHMGTVAVIAALAGWLGPRIHHWKTARLG